ncbi:MAG: flagellar basal body L-ring protein FlgH [Beijerinckiaceae bacterium]|nr:flagellar basal body L-ring protein FlgH [Beijerinckiaceae bacterium]
MRVMALAASAGLLAGCAGDIREIGREPFMSPVGTGLIPDVQPSASALFIPVRAPGQGSAIFDGRRANIFGDVRAVKIGDVVTVQIAINDRATFGNASDRSLAALVNTGFDFKLESNGRTTELKPQFDSSAASTTFGQGSIDRSEKMQLSVAAVVTDVLPNGNLIISGSQEVRVNFELRLLNVAGIARPQDISRENTIAYDKIAEARISYGGRGRIMEVQQPTLIQQIYDRLKPL